MNHCPSLLDSCLRYPPALLFSFASSHPNHTSNQHCKPPSQKVEAISTTTAMVAITTPSTASVSKCRDANAITPPSSIQPDTSTNVVQLRLSQLPKMIVRQEAIPHMLQITSLQILQTVLQLVEVTLLQLLNKLPSTMQQGEISHFLWVATL